MKKEISLFAKLVLVFSWLLVATAPGAAQNAPDNPDRAATLRTNSKILYHGGPVLVFAQHVYFIFYGCWGTPQCGSSGDIMAPTILTTFASTIGNSSYMSINSTYTDGAGVPASAALVYSGTVFDNSYSHGSFDLTRADIEGIIADQVGTFSLPHDPEGIYVVVASGDVSSNSTGFCTPLVPPLHGSGIINGGSLTYIFLGNPIRCPSAAAPFVGQPSPNGSFTGDALVLNLAHALNGLLTNPNGSGWFDRYGLENADKCSGTFGQLYTTANGARANFSVGGRDYLLEQNWVNGRKAFCGMSP